MNRFLGAALAAALAFSAIGATAQEDTRTVEVHFAPGTTGISETDRIKGYQSVLYKVGAEAGQTMDITLSTEHTSTYFNVYAPGSGPGDQALAVSQFTENTMIPDINRFSGTLPASGEYTISVYMMRSAARRDEVAEYVMDISVVGATGDAVKADHADGLLGGPDFWEVQVNDPVGSLNVRAEPSAGAAKIGGFPNREVLRNLGCRMSEGRRWCQVEGTAPGSITGWVAGDFLVESGGPGAASSAAPAAAQGAESATGTPTPAEQACLAAVSNTTNNGEVAVLSSEFSQAGTLVMIGVGPQRAPWKCIAYSDGSTDGIEFQGEG